MNYASNPYKKSNKKSNIIAKKTHSGVCPAGTNSMNLENIINVFSMNLTIIIYIFSINLKISRSLLAYIKKNTYLCSRNNKLQIRWLTG